MEVYKCERCGKSISVTKSKEIENIKCSHCNKEYELDKKTKRSALLLVALFVFLLAFLVTLIAEILKISPYILLIPMMVVSIFVYRFALYVLAKANKVNYQAKN